MKCVYVTEYGPGAKGNTKFEDKNKRAFCNKKADFLINGSSYCYEHSKWRS